MDEFIKELDADLDYLEHEITADEVILYVASNRKSCRCPYCGHTSMRIHSRYEKVFRICPSWERKRRSSSRTGNSSVTIRTAHLPLSQSVLIFRAERQKDKAPYWQDYRHIIEYQFCCSVKDIKGRDCRGREKHHLQSLKKRDTAPWKAFHNKSVYWWFRIPEKTDLWHYHGGHWYTPCGRPACIPWGGRCGGMA